MTLFPSLDESLVLHDKIITRFGGTRGVRDMGLLESALFRPQSGYYKGIGAMAAALMESLLLNHPFIDGNKRVAFFLTDTFLRMNGFKIKVGASAGENFVINAIAKSKDRYAYIVSWLTKHVVKMK